MFLEFFYLLRAKGLDVSINEWMILVEALDKGLAQSSLMGFYHLCRSILIKTEAEYDKFDAVFAEYFKNVQTPEDLPEEFWNWLNECDHERPLDDKGDGNEFPKELEELLRDVPGAYKGAEGKARRRQLLDRYRRYIGYGPRRIPYDRHQNRRHSRHKSAVQVAGERNFQDFREDKILDIRQFQMAFRRLQPVFIESRGAGDRA